MNQLPKPHGTTNSPSYSYYSTDTPHHSRTDNAAAHIQHVNTGTLNRSNEYIQSPGGYHFTEPSRPTRSSQNVTQQMRTKSHSRRPPNLATSLTSSDALSPPALVTRPPTSSHGLCPRISQNNDHRVPEHRQVTPKLAKALQKENISQPTPSPAYTNFEERGSYEAHRPPPTTPPRTHRNGPSTTSPQHLFEVSYIEWDGDGDDTSALTKVKNSLGLGQVKRPTKPARQIIAQPKSPDMYVNATPRPAPTKPTRQAPPAQPAVTHPPLSRSSKSCQTTDHTFRSVVRPREVLKEEPFYQGPDLTGKVTTTEVEYANVDDFTLQLRCDSERRARNNQVLAAVERPLPRINQTFTSYNQQAQQQQRTAPHPPSFSSTSGVGQETSQPSSPTYHQECQLRHRQRVDTTDRQPQTHARQHRDNVLKIQVPTSHERSHSDQNLKYLANEALPFNPPPTPSSTASASQSPTKQKKLRSLVQGLVSKASGGDLKKDRERKTM